ncbi:alanine--tRNA ligase, partial [Candidatus Dojkabacteria bacterium]|nr:alanine--tRNA ligase [Candidatus Dojkabacteria bacterium]
MRTSEEIRESFIKFWTSEPRNAKEVPNVSLVPNNDPTLLFVNSGMFPINPYLAGQPHPLGTRLCDFQRCLRTNYDEMLEIGDNRHTLMFEMMGDWSLGDFTKKDQIPWIMEFWVDVCGLDPKRIYVSVFEGNHDAPRDEEAIKVWKETFEKYGVKAEFSEDITNIPADLAEGEEWTARIFPYNKKKNWWQRAADAPGELGGPTSEMFYDTGDIVIEQDKYHINDDSGRFIEIGNNVFMEYKYSEDGKWEEMTSKNIDFGGGFERVVMLVQNKKDIFETDIYEPVLNKITELSGKEYKSLGEETEDTKYFRILADHARAATFIIADGVKPSNKDQGYVLRRFIRRLVRFGLKLGIEENFTKYLAEVVIDKMQHAYTHLDDMKDIIMQEIEKEEIKFRSTLNNGLREIQKLVEKGEKLDGNLAFYVYETYGFPLEMTLEEFGVDEDGAESIEKEFKEKNDAHREASRAGAEQKFKGGLADHSVEVTKLHTTHHLLLRALQIVLGDHIHQRGSNITGERLRIDFSHPDKLTDAQIKE